MSVKRKLNTKTLKEKCDILSHIEKGMTNKEAADKFGVSKNKFEKLFTEDRIASKKQKNICDFFKAV